MCACGGEFSALRSGATDVMMVDETEGVGVVVVPLDLIQRLTVFCGLGGMDKGGCMVGGRVPHWAVVCGKFTKGSHLPEVAGWH